MLFIYFQLQVYIAVKTRVFIENLLSQGQEPASNENLEIYDPDLQRIFTKAKQSKKAKLAIQIKELMENGETASDAGNHFKNFPTVDSAFGNDFTVLPTFVPTDTLEHLKNCRKNTRKSADAVAEFACKF